MVMCKVSEIFAQGYNALIGIPLMNLGIPLMNLEIPLVNLGIPLILTFYNRQRYGIYLYNLNIFKMFNHFNGFVAYRDREQGNSQHDRCQAMKQTWP